MKMLKNKYVMITLIFTLLIGLSFICFSVYKNNYQSNITVNDLSFNITTNSKEIDKRILKLSSNKQEDFKVLIRNLNKSNVKYELTYDVCMDDICSNIVNYLPENININYDKTLKNLKNGKRDEIIISTENNTTKDVYIKIKINAVYEWNELELVSKNDNMNNLNLNGINIISYVDGIEVSYIPNSCSYNVTVDATDSSGNEIFSSLNLVCNYLTNKWSISFSDFDKLPSSITLRFVSENLPEDAYVTKYEFISSNVSWKEPYSIFTATENAVYKLETWGAQGGRDKGGYGSYSTGEITLNKGDNLYIYIGNNPTMTNNYSVGGYNGGGYSCNSNIACGGGGGATHIARRTGLLKDLSSNIDDILLVSGGGGGGCNCNIGDGKCAGGSGGGIEGVKNVTVNKKYNNIYSGGNQTGPSGRTFGQASPSSSASSDCTGGGGGGGFYPGRRGNLSTGSGGSGYIGNTDLTNKYMYCYDCTESTDENTYTINTIGSSDLTDKKNCPNGYSEEPISKCAKAGNGYAKITFLRLVNSTGN